jgi:predicted CXXCH cytochrome family protein
MCNLLRYLRIRNACLPAIALALVSAFATPRSQAQTAAFVGSQACKSCHEQLYSGWSQTRMANVVRDPKAHPEAVLGDFAHPTSAVTFKLDDVAFTYGSRWKQRYFTKRGDDYFPLPAQWDVAKRIWLPYHVEAGTDWWVPFYGPTNNDRPTGPTCDGCHSVNYSIETKKVTEWNVGCEKCHGPGSLHAANPKLKIVNPADLDFVRGNDTCIQCHSQGQRLVPPTQNNAYDWPVGYLPGDRLADFWKLEELKPGVTSFLQFPDLTGHKNRMQGNDFVQSNMYHRQIRCFDCHDVHSAENTSNLKRAGNALCLNCHDSGNPAGLFTTVAEHTRHAEGSAGSQCTACHMPKIEQTIKDNYVSAHTFRFITPGESERTGIPNACVSCHAGKSNAWAAAELKKWPAVSPWRVAN